MNGKREGEGNEPGFERDLARLEEIVQELEEGDRPLEESLRLFEEGIGLARRLEERLNEAEQRVEMLVRAADGKDETVPWQSPEEDR